MALHILEYPDDVTTDQIERAFAVLGLDHTKVRSITITTSGFEADVYVEDLVGRRRGDTVHITVPTTGGHR